MAGTSLFDFLDTLLPDEDQLPARVQLRVGGLTDLCSPKLDRAASNTEGELLQYLERAGPDSRFLCFFVDELLRDISVHGVYYHVLDGRCLARKHLQESAQSFGMVVAALCMAVLVWMNVRTARTLEIWFVCRAGKHRSMLLAVCYFVLWLVFKSTRRRVEISLDWTAGRRIIEETAASHTEGKPAAKHRFRQPNNVVNRAKERLVAHLRHGNLDVVLADVGDPRRVVSNRGGQLQWLFERMLTPDKQQLLHALGAERHAMMVFQTASSAENSLLASWQPCFQCICESLPEKCSLCSPRDVPVDASWCLCVRATMLQQGLLDPSASQTMAGRVEGGGLALRPASSSATMLQQGLLDPSASQTMAGRVEGGGLALRPASSTDAPERAARSVRFHPRPEVIEVESRRRAVAIRRRADFLAVVACAHVDMSEDEQAASAMFAPARGSHKPAMYLLDSSAADTWGQAAGALEARLTADAALQDELNAHESHMLDVCGLPSSLVAQQTSWLGRCQFAIFLHMMAILRSAGGAYVPAQLLRRLGAHCRELEVDVMMLVQRYLYFCCALRNVAAEAWQGSAYCVFLPRTQGARSWWAAMQTCLQECDLWAYFVDEYLLWPAPDPGGEDFPSFGAALRAASKRAQMSEVSEPAPVPDLHFLVHHDTLLSAEEVLACPRVLAPLRPTARAAEGSWGGNDGSYADVTPQNLAQEAHAHVRVAAALPPSLTMRQLVGQHAEEFLWHGLHACGLRSNVHTLSLGVSAGDDALASLGISPSEGDGLQLAFQALGHFVLSRLQPANVMHPHLRGPVELHIGALFARQLASRNLHEVTVLDFMDGAGVRFCSDDSRAWARALPADKDARKCQQAFVHTMWGGRAQPVWDGYTRSYQLVQQCCPYMLRRCMRSVARSIGGPRHHSQDARALVLGHAGQSKPRHLGHRQRAEAAQHRFLPAGGLRMRLDAHAQ